MSSKLELKLESKVFPVEDHSTKLIVTIDKTDKYPITIDLEVNDYTIDEVREIVGFLNNAIKLAEHKEVFGQPGL